MSTNNEESQRIPSSNQNSNKVHVNNHFNFSIHFGDSLNLVALIAGVYIVRRLFKTDRLKKRNKLIDLRNKKDVTR